MKPECPNPYESIINHPHHVSKKHPSMTMRERAAQFSPFSALSGFDAVLKEAELSISAAPAENLKGGVTTKHA